MRSSATVAAFGLVLALAAGAQAFAPGDCLNPLQFSGATMAADLKIVFSGAAGLKKDVKAQAKSKKGGGAALGGSVPLAFKAGSKGCTLSAASLSDVSAMGSMELGTATVAPYLVTVAPMTGSISKKGQTINYDVKDLKLQISASGGVGLQKANKGAKFDPTIKIVSGNMTITLSYTPKDGPAGTATVAIDLSTASIAKVGSCQLRASDKTGAFELDCKKLSIQLAPVTKQAATGGSLTVDITLKGDNVVASGALSATASVPEPVKLDPKAVADAAAYVAEVVDTQGVMKEPAKCTSSFLVNDDIPDFDNTRVYVECDAKWYEVNSIYLTAQKVDGAAGCDVLAATAADKGASLGFDNSYSGQEDPFYVAALYKQWSRLVYYPPTNYAAAYTATFRYKLARAGSADSIATVTCEVGAPITVNPGP